MYFEINIQIIDEENRAKKEFVMEIEKIRDQYNMTKEKSEELKRLVNDAR